MQFSLPKNHDESVAAHPFIIGSVTLSIAAMAMAASTALPPSLTDLQTYLGRQRLA